MYNLGGDDGITRQELITMFNSIRGEPVPVRGFERLHRRPSSAR